MAFVDYQRPFYSVGREKLWSIVKDNGCHQNCMWINKKPIPKYKINYDFATFLLVVIN